MLKSIKMCFALVLIHMCNTGFSQGLSNVIVHGFVSQGYLKSTENNFLANSKDGSFEFNEAAINFIAEVNKNLRVGLQLFSRDLGLESNNNVILDWAYGDYHWQDYLGVRFGKIKLPAGFYNYIRDVDLARTSILLPQSVYDETTRDFSLAQQGLELYGNIRLHLNSALEYQLYYGTLTIPSADTPYWNWIFADFPRFFEDAIGTIPEIDFKDKYISGEYIRGFAFKYQSPIQGLLLGASHASGRLHLLTSFDLFIPDITPRDLLVNMNIDVDIKYHNIYSMEYALGDFILRGEYFTNKYETFISLDILTDPINVNFESLGYYGQIEFPILGSLKGSYYYAEYYPDKSDKKGVELPKVGRPEYFAWQKDHSFSLYYDLMHHWNIKLEGHIMNGGALSQLFDIKGSPSKKNWYLCAIKTSFYF